MEVLFGLFLSLVTFLVQRTFAGTKFAHHKFMIEHHNLQVRVEITEQLVPTDFKIEYSVKEKLYLYTLIIEEMGTKCKIVMNGPKIVENFDNLDQFIHEEEKFLKPIFLQLNSQDSKLFQVDNFFITHWSLESKAKFLPYEFRQLHDLYTFRFTQYPNVVPSTSFEVLATPACKPTINMKDFHKLHPWYKDKDRTGSTSFKKKETQGGQAAAYQNSILFAGESHHTNNSKTSPAPVYRSMRSRRSPRYRRQSSDNTTDSTPTVAPTEMHDPNECDFNNEINRWQCRLVTANILHEDQRHVYMIAIYMQLYLMAMAGAFKPKTTDFEVCTFSMEPYNFFNKDIEVGGRPRESDKYTMHECCEVLVHSREAFSMADFQPGRFELTYWRCHDPYQLTKRTLYMIPYIAFVLTLLSPMFVMGWLPGLKSAAAKKRLVRLEQSLRRTRRQKLKKSRDPADNEEHKTEPGRSSDYESTRDTRLKIRLNEDEKPQTELIPSNHPGKHPNTKWQLTELIWLDANPIYTFNFKTIISYLFFFNVESHLITVVRRYVFFLGLGVLLFLGLAQLQIYYTTISYRSVLWMFRFAYQNVLAVHLHRKADFTVGMLLYTLAIPAITALILLFLLFPISSQPRSTAETLHWEEHETRLGRYMAVHCQIPVRRHDSFEAKIIDNMSTRIGYLGRAHLYKFFGERFLFPLPESLIIDEDEDDSKTVLTKRILVVLWYIAKLPIFILVLPTYVFPAFTMWYALLIAPSRVLKSKSQYGQMCRLVIVACGLVLLNIVAFYLCVVYGQMFVFLIIDFIRNMKTQMPQIIFYLSLLYNINAAFNKFADDYLDLKSKMFDILKETVQPEQLESTTKDDKRVSVIGSPSKNSNLSPGSRRKRFSMAGVNTPDKRKIPPLADPEDESPTGDKEPPQEEPPPKDPSTPPPLLIATNDGEVGMPLTVFEYVCERHMPYGSKVGSMLFRLAIHLIIISFLFIIVLDFQVLDALQDIGQGLITLITVSLPSLAASAASAGLAHIQEEKFMNALRQTLQVLMEDKEFWSVYMHERKLEEEEALERQRRERERNQRKDRKKKKPRPYSSDDY